MRKVANFDQEKRALRFWDYLKKQGIDSTLEKVESDKNSRWEIWVEDEDLLGQAFLYLDEFSNNPEDEKFTTNLKTHKEDKQKDSFAPRGFKQFNLREKWRTHDRSPGTMTLSLIITSVAVFLLSGMGNNAEIVKAFFISQSNDNQLNEIFSGEIWRAFTPIFIHFSLWHIFFNMYWLYEFGGQIEKIKGAKFLISFILLIALASNLSQFFTSGHEFGGMSGVVYGLFGYIWVKTRLGPAEGFRLDPLVAILMFGFFLLCFTGVLGGIANWAHAGGLLVGLAWGYGSALRWNHGRG